jgi:hypothetical protein
VISEEQAEAAVIFLRDSAEKAAAARGNVALLEQMLKVTRAKLKSRSTVKTDSGREDEALSSAEYVEIVKGYQAAVEEDSLYRMKREAAIARLDFYRTLQANIRGMSR